MHAQATCTESWSWLGSLPWTDNTDEAHCSQGSGPGCLGVTSQSGRPAVMQPQEHMSLQRCQCLAGLPAERQVAITFKQGLDRGPTQEQLGPVGQSDHAAGAAVQANNKGTRSAGSPHHDHHSKHFSMDTGPEAPPRSSSGARYYRGTRGGSSCAGRTQKAVCKITEQWHRAEHFKFSDPISIGDVLRKFFDPCISASLSFACGTSTYSLRPHPGAAPGRGSTG